MIASTASSTSLSARTPGVRRRADLAAVRQRYQGKSSWIVKNPLSLEYYRLLDEEYYLLSLLDGQTSYDAIQAAFEQRFAPQTIDEDEIGRYIAQLHRCGLVTTDTPGQAKTLAARRRQDERQSWLSRFGSPLALRFRGADPEPVLNWLYPKMGWFFSPRCVGCCLLLMFTALLLVAARFDQFIAALPTFHEFFTPANGFLLVVTLATVKIVHEFGHGLTCKHFGGECHEMGFMLLCFAPTMYCNVSDSWMLPNKWHRAAIGAAGIYVELVMASLAVFVWRYTEPGLLHALALNVIFVCSISTLVFNANPLLRYDGYYIAGDLLEITNLGSKASDALRQIGGRLCCGLNYQLDEFAPTRGRIVFAVYAVASAVYRAFVFVSILWFVNKCFEPYRLDVIGQALGTLAVVGLVLAPLRRVQRFLSVPGRWTLVNKTRLSATLSVLGGLLLATCVVPLPHRVYAPLEVRPRDAQAVYAEAKGVLMRTLVKPGDRVVAGQPLVELADVDLALDVERLVGRRDEAKVVLASLHQQQFRDATADVRLTVAEQTATALEQLVAQRHRDLQRLVPKAPAAGTVLPPPEIPADRREAGELATWTGTPLDEWNLGATLPAGTMLCRIGDPARMEAVLVVDQGDVEFLKLGQAVEILLEELPGRTWHGTIREISKTDVKVTPRQLSNKAGGEVATKTDAGGGERPRSTSYQVRVQPLDDPDGLLRMGLSGRAQIHAGSQTAASMLARAFAKTFRFDW